MSFRARFSSRIQRGARGRPPPNRFHRTSGPGGPYSKARCISSRAGLFDSHAALIQSVVWQETIEDLQQGINDRLAKGVGGVGNLVVGHLACCQRQIGTLFGDNGARSFDGPLSKIAAIFNGHCFDDRFVVHLRFLLSLGCTDGMRVEFCVRASSDMSTVTSCCLADCLVMLRIDGHFRKSSVYRSCLSEHVAGHTGC
jgi:hypothetical protein